MYNSRYVKWGMQYPKYVQNIFMWIGALYGISPQES